MKREIKFRTWDSVDKLMREKIQGRYWTGLEVETGKIVHIQEGKIIDSPKDRLILMQFTGLLDKNGKEIYEGDIVQDHIGIGQIKYNKWGCPVVSYGDGKAKYFSDYLESEGIPEIIGNIYENPDLISKYK